MPVGVLSVPQINEIAVSFLKHLFLVKESFECRLAGQKAMDYDHWLSHNAIVDFEQIMVEPNIFISCLILSDNWLRFLNFKFRFN